MWSRCRKHEGRLPPYLRGPRRTATEPDVFEKEDTHMTCMELGHLFLGTPASRGARCTRPDERVVVLARALDFVSGYLITVMTRSPPFSAARGSTRLRCVVSKVPG